MKLAQLSIVGIALLGVCFLWTMREVIRELEAAIQRLPTTETAVQESISTPYVVKNGVRILRAPGMTLEEFIEAIQSGGPKNKSWVSGGDQYQFVLPQKIGETQQEYCDRFDEYCEALMEAFPED